MADPVLAEVSATVLRFAPVVPAWATAARLTLDDVRQEIALASLAGADPAREVPRQLGIRRVGDAWRAFSPAAGEDLGEGLAANDDDGMAVWRVGDDADVDAAISALPRPVARFARLFADGASTDEAAARLGCTQRAAQKALAEALELLWEGSPRQTGLFEEWQK